MLAAPLSFSLVNFLMPIAMAALAGLLSRLALAFITLVTDGEKGPNATLNLFGSMQKEATNTSRNRSGGQNNEPGDDKSLLLLSYTVLRELDRGFDLQDFTAECSLGYVYAPKAEVFGENLFIKPWVELLKVLELPNYDSFWISILSKIPSFFYRGSTNSLVEGGETSPRDLLAQLQAIVHKPLGFATSPSLPGTINSPWWTDFSHLIYWFYFVSTFATVAFLWYLYDFRVRRAETAHPIRETRGFSRAQTGDLVTAVLPLTWSATMVMHASTHSINFDENTAGTAFSFTVVAYQWGWNYYFPRDIVALLEAAPKVVGRGKIVRFEASPVEDLETSQWDSWALRATIGNRHGSRGGRLNTSSALSLVLPTDIPGGNFSSLKAVATAPSLHWRKALSATLNEISNPPFKSDVKVPQSFEVGMQEAPSFGLGTPTLFRAKPTAYISGSRIHLTYRHLAPQFEAASFASSSVVTANIYVLEGDDIQTRAERGHLSTPEPTGLPDLENISGGLKSGVNSPLPASTLSRLDLNNLRGPSLPSTQHMVWTGPDAVTGGGSTALGSTEDHGWVSPVAAREASLRSALAVKASLLSFLELSPSTQKLGGASHGSFLLPFDLNSRTLLNHPGSWVGLPFSWTLASLALEVEIDSSSIKTWVGALVPDLSGSALPQPTTLLGGQRTPSVLNSLLSPLALGLRGFPLTPLEPEALRPSTKALTPSYLVWYMSRGVPSSFTLIAQVYPESKPSAGPRYWEAPNSTPKKIDGFGPIGLIQGVDLHQPSPSRLKTMPSAPGLGLDEARLARVGSSKLVDPSMVAAKLENPSTPSLISPSNPLSILGLGWSTTASLSAYPSYKLSRGGVLRRPFSGLSPSVRPLEGLKEGLSPLSLGKTSHPMGLPALTLSRISTPKFYITPPSLDTQTGAWSSVWACFTPAPMEDLDPSFVNLKWTPEINTTRRSDHNSRYLVSWSPLLAPLTSGSSLSRGATGPAPRAAQSPLLLRSSLLALNELGLKNSFGSRGTRPFVGTSEFPGFDDSVAEVRPAAGMAPASCSAKWASLWGSLSYPQTNPYVSTSTQRASDRLSGRASAILTSQSLLLRGGVPTLGALNIGGNDRSNPLVNALASLEFSLLGGLDFALRPRQGYLPINSDISTSRRLRVTKGITLPSDIPMHVICGSKDVIHSWAIPGLNVKIDCIPGYNSHRRLLLR